MSIPTFTRENIEKALHQLYYDPSVEAKDVAQQWLTKAQRSPEAWQFAWELLHEDKATEVQYFGASALISKIAGAWSDIPTSEIFVLRNRLFEQITKFSEKGEKQIVLTRLCVAFSAFVANCTIKQLWPTATQDIIEKFHGKEKSSHDDRSCHALLEILTIIAEEFQTSKIDKYKKGLLLHFLKAGKTQVLHLLVDIFRVSKSKAVQARVIKCLSSWIVYGVSLDDCHELILSVFECIKDPELFDQSVECLLNAFCSPLAQDYPLTVKKCMPLMVGLRPLFEQSVADEDPETALGLTKVICGLAENFPKLIIETCTDPQYGLGIICMVLDCGRIPLQYPTDEFSSPLSFTFWCSLQDEIEALNTPERIAVCERLVPYFYELVNCLLIKARYPKDNSHNEWSAEEKESHRIYRVDVSDSLMYILEMLGQNLVIHIFGKLQVSLQEAGADQEKQWHDIEVCLFALHSTIESLAEFHTEIPCLQTLTEILPTLHVSSLQLADTMLYTIGILTDWLNLHSENLLPLVSIVLKCLSNQELALSAVLTARRLMRECCDDLIPYSNDIMQHFTNLLLSGSLQRKVEVWLMQAAGHMLSVIARDDCLKYLEKLLDVHLHQLEALSKDEVSAPNKTSILHIFDLLANLFCTLERRKEGEDGKMVKVENEEQPAVLILNQIHPVIQRVLTTWISERDIVDALCQMYDKAIRCLVEDFAPLLIQVCEMLCVVFQNYPYPSIMNLSQQVVLVFAREAAHFDTVCKLFHCLVSAIVPLYHNDTIKQHPDVAQAFMSCMSHACSKCYDLIKAEYEKNSQTTLTDLFKCAMVTLQFPDSESVSYSSSLICDFISLYTKRNEVAATVDANAKELFVIVLRAIGGASPRLNMDKFADILSSMARANFPLFNMCLEQAISLPDIPCSTVDIKKKTLFVKQLLREVKRKQKYRDIVKEFTLVCRGLHGTEYAAS